MGHPNFHGMGLFLLGMWSCRVVTVAIQHCAPRKRATEWRAELSRVTTLVERVGGMWPGFAVVLASHHDLSLTTQPSI